MRVPTHLKTPQGHDLTLGTNCLGPFLFTKLLHPLLEATAKTAPAGAVRVVWLGSMTIDLEASKHGMDLGNLDYRKKDEPSNKRYAVSKTGNYFLGAEWARRDAGTGIVHLTANPGNLKTDLQRTMGAVTRTILNTTLPFPLLSPKTTSWVGTGLLDEKTTLTHGAILLPLFQTLLLHDAVYGAYTELWAGLSPAVKPSDSGRYVIPWGRLGSVRKDIEEAARPEAEGGLGMAAKFFEYCDEQTKSFA
ncbi:hypothetical protein VTK73DRAFT_5445 [Phialemonium thermophilum]|uniref:Uncharacterized protein n=1 Tax=Phialemonium thermophilum TaxID=223376 RepID=A0ABR3V279_9PEZI